MSIDTMQIRISISNKLLLDKLKLRYMEDTKATRVTYDEILKILLEKEMYNA